MSSQKFETGDLVHVAKDLGPRRKHFSGADRDAIVVGSYADQYGGDDHESYSIFLKGRGATSWYDGSDLTLIERGRIDLLRQWRDEYEDARRRSSGWAS